MNYEKTIKGFEKKHDFRKTKSLGDMIKYYGKDVKGREEIVYEVFIKVFSPINLGLTVVNSGKINGKFYMTSGHIHKNKTPEFYVLLEGEGILMTKKRNDKKTKIIKMKKGKIELIGEGYAHRLVNNGSKKLKVLTIYHEDSKPDYNVKFETKIKK